MAELSADILVAGGFNYTDPDDIDGGSRYYPTKAAARIVLRALYGQTARANAGTGR